MSIAARLVYTVCFLKQKNKLLLLNREAPPNMGLWNGVGGKIEPGETAYESVIREIREETGIVVDQVQFGGIVTWENPDQTDKLAREGMYLFLAELADRVETKPVENMEEGILAWKEIKWVMNPKNTGVATNIPFFLPKLLSGSEPQEYYCTYDGYQLLACEELPLPEEADPMLVKGVAVL